MPFIFLIVLKLFLWIRFVADHFLFKLRLLLPVSKMKLKLLKRRSQILCLKGLTWEIGNKKNKIRTSHRWRPKRSINKNIKLRIKLFLKKRLNNINQNLISEMWRITSRSLLTILSRKNKLHLKRWLWLNRKNRMSKNQSLI